MTISVPQYGFAAFVLAMGAVRFWRVLDVLRGKTPDARPPAPEALREVLKPERPSSGRVRSLVREMVAIPLVAGPVVAAILLAGLLPGVSHTLDRKLTGGVHPEGFVGYERMLEDLSAEASTGVVEVAGPPSSPILPKRNGAGRVLVAILVVLAPAGLLGVVWLLGRSWPLAARIPAALVGIAVALVAFAAAGSAAAELAGTRRRVELVEALRRLPVSTPAETAGHRGPVKMQGIAEVTGGRGAIYRSYQETDAQGALVDVEETAPFRMGDVNVAMTDARFREVYNRPGAISIGGGQRVIVLGELSGGVLRGTSSVPLVVAPVKHEAVYLQMASRSGLRLHRALACAAHLLTAGCGVLFLAWTVKGPAREAEKTASA